MAPKNRIIIDTDPGCDDVLAMLLALSAPATELEVLLISVTFGNVDVKACLQNVVVLFHVLDLEMQWRKDQGLSTDGFQGIRNFQPLVAVGAEGPLQDRIEHADYFHGRDGLGGTSQSHPEFQPKDEKWKKLFERPPPEDYITTAAREDIPSSKGNELEEKLTNHPTETDSFKSSTEPAHKEILRLLKENEPGTITLVALGPLTNYALAAAEDPSTFLRCKELVTMGGAVSMTGNVTPNAEFNVFADPYAAARVYALSSQLPASTMPLLSAQPGPKDIAPTLPPQYPSLKPDQKPLCLRLFALDITEQHTLSRGLFKKYANPLIERKSPLASWISAFLTPVLDRMEDHHHGHEGDDAALALHDPLCIWYILTQDSPKWKPSPKSPEDIRVETLGQWTRGMTVADGRNRKRRNSDGEAPHDRGNWLGNQSGNRVWRMLESPGTDQAAEDLMRSVLGC